MSAHNVNTPPPLISLLQAVNLLQQGQVIIYPTESIYGLGCDPLHERAVHQILQLKKREVKHGLILVAGSLEHITPWINDPEDITAEILTTWPGPVTWVFKKSALCPHWISGDHDSVAIRFSAHPVVQKLTCAFGGVIVSTSANLHQQPPSKDPREVHLSLPEISMVSGSIGTNDKPSLIFDAYTQKQLR